MPWSTPTLKTVRMMTRDFVLSQLGAKAMIPNSVLRIMSDAMSGLGHLTLIYIDWLALQLLPDTAETVWLDRHANIWLVNSDGSTGRKAATYAGGTVEFQGDPGIIANGSLLSGPNRVQYQTLADATIGDTGGDAPVTALTAGSVGNLLDGTQLGVINPTTNITSVVALGDISGGADTETDDELRERVLRRIRNPPMGGDVADYEVWALAVPGVTRAWAASEQGPGTITVRFLMDDLRASDDGWPAPGDVMAVAAYIDTMRPVTVKDCYVLAPIKEFVDITIANLLPNTPEAQSEIEASIQEMLFAQAAPGQTIYASWVSYAIMNAPSVQSFTLVTTADYVMPNLGSMAVLETILYQ